MSERKEMIPADLINQMNMTLEKQWGLLCRIRQQIKYLILVQPMRVADFRRKLKSMLAGMDDVFDDWPEDPK